ncbi:hypothetical protein [Corallococcus exercitus]|uniref:Uncharacterized protein n=1 Tax=Corallococcus exercitus TaxID=2316736 RepID=A0A7Y4JZP4_9BACT|nr:hypothetical protein [Corallococcus exercitus]NOK14203.1 hypothetical protein [Corallococcus exercitus]
MPKGSSAKKASTAQETPAASPSESASEPATPTAQAETGSSDAAPASTVEGTPPTTEAASTEAPSRKAPGRGAKRKTSEAEAAPAEPTAAPAEPPAPPASSEEPSSKSKRAARTTEEPAPAPSAPAKPARTVEPQYLILTGGSPFLRAIGSVRRPEGEPLPGFGNLAVTKMSAAPLPTEPGQYEFRFQASNGTGDFKLAQRSENGAPRNVRDFEMASSGGFQSYRFSIP